MRELGSDRSRQNNNKKTVGAPPTDRVCPSRAYARARALVQGRAVDRKAPLARSVGGDNKSDDDEAMNQTARYAIARSSVAAARARAPACIFAVVVVDAATAATTAAAMLAVTRVEHVAVFVCALIIAVVITRYLRIKKIKFC